MKELDNKLNDSFLKDNEFIFKKYKPIKKIGSGTFGNIYSTIRVKDNNVFAMKTEKLNAKIKTLESEAYFLYLLQGFGIPKLITYGHTKKYNILIETLLDKSLHAIFIKRKKLCNLIDTYFIGMQILDRLEFIHSKDIIYRDVKPENFLIGLNDPNVIYIVDFGLCKKYRSSKTGKHILPKITKRFNGTLRYASFNAVRGKELSRRDDLISLGYMLIFLYKRSLPWESDFKKLTKSKYFELLYFKYKDGCGQLFKNIPPEIADFVKYSKNLKFEQDPDYSYLRSLLNNIIIQKHLDYRKLTFSWIDSKDKNLLGIPRSSSSKRSSPHYRILKNIKEERSKRVKLDTLSLPNIRNNSNELSNSTKNNSNIYSNFNCHKIFNNISSENLMSNNISLNNIKLISQKENELKKNVSERKIKQKSLGIKKIIYKNRNIINSIISNENSIINDKKSNDNYNSQINEIYNINSEEKKNKTKLINTHYRKINPMIYKIKNYSLNITPNISYKNSINSFNPLKNYKNNFKNIDQKSLNSLHKKNDLLLNEMNNNDMNFQNNILYQSPLLKKAISKLSNRKIKKNDNIRNRNSNILTNISQKTFKLINYNSPIPLNSTNYNIIKNRKRIISEKDLNIILINNNIQNNKNLNKNFSLRYSNTTKSLKNKSGINNIYINYINSSINRHKQK